MDGFVSLLERFGKLGVTEGMIVGYLGHALERASAVEYEWMTRLCRAIETGACTWESAAEYKELQDLERDADTARSAA